MGCNPWDNTLTTSCVANQPGDGSGVSVEFEEYPLATVRADGSYNIPGREGVAVMYPSIYRCASPVPTIDSLNSASNCGKMTRVVPHNGFSSDPCIFIYDNYPNQLSFDYGYSDRYFSYIFDTSNQQGIIGKPCFYYETSEATTNDGTSDTGVVAGGRCLPCSGFTCTPASTTLSYTLSHDALTNDPDCPHPTLFGFGSDKNKLAFSYDQLSSTIPNGVTDFSFSYDGVTYVDAWNQDEVSGIPYESTQNPPYQSGDEAFTDFTIFELNDTPNNKTGLRVKIETKSLYDDSGASTVFTGTQWLATEVLNPGTGYAVNDVFSLTYTHTHPDNSTSTLTLNLKITAVGQYQATSGQSGFDVLRAGDTLNGHEITRAFHTDIDNFPYHIIYLDGNGNDFTKDTQYTSDRNHVVTAKAGYGIKDRAILIGMYEFIEKSMQFTTADIDQNAPDTFNVLVQPKVTPTVTNGIVTAVTINDGGSGWNQYGREPEVIITPPLVATGTPASVKAEFTNGVMTAIKVDLGGTGYSSTNLPQIVVKNIHKRQTLKFENNIDKNTMTTTSTEVMSAVPAGEGNEYLEITGEEKAKFTDTIDKIETETTYQDNVPSIKLKLDPNRQRINKLPQRMYRKELTEGFKEETSIKYDLNYLEDVDIPRSYKDEFTKEKDRSGQHRLDDIEAITQDVVPEFSNHDESFIETVQGPTSALPHASTYTKYMMKQYRPDPTRDTNLTITLSCTPVDTGCAHFTCTAPSPQSGGTVDNGDGTTTTTTYTMAGVLGDGCKAWTATGNLKMYNDMTTSTTQWVNATSAYGNPFDE